MWFVFRMLLEEYNKWRKIDKLNREENYIRKRINYDRTITAKQNDILWKRQKQITKIQVYGAETWKFNIL